LTLRFRKYVPEVRKLPPQYLYEPWEAPKSVQEAAGCVVGKDYPKRIVIHENVLKTNIGRMAEAYKENKQPPGKISVLHNQTLKQKYEANP